jgi:hypothetical protein
VTERDRLEDLVANGKMVLTGMLRKCGMCELDIHLAEVWISGLDWIHLAEVWISGVC